jgi:hypothetical protein
VAGASCYISGGHRSASAREVPRVACLAQTAVAQQLVSGQRQLWVARAWTPAGRWPVTTVWLRRSWEGGATEVPPPNLVLLPRRSGHRDLLRCLGRWPKPWGWAASPGAPHRAGVLQGPWRRAAPAGGPSGDRPRLTVVTYRRLQQETHKLLIGYSRASILAAVGRSAQELQQDRHTHRRVDSGRRVCATACKRSTSLVTRCSTRRGFRRVVDAVLGIA